MLIFGQNVLAHDIEYRRSLTRFSLLCEYYAAQNKLLSC